MRPFQETFFIQARNSFMYNANAAFDIKLLTSGNQSDIRGVDSFLNPGGGAGSSVRGIICPLWFE